MAREDRERQANPETETEGETEVLIHGVFTLKM
jgi:hypothetical protein